MSVHYEAGQIPAPVAIVAGIFICFLGYRILKLTLGITGFALGAFAGAAIASSMAPDHQMLLLAWTLFCGLIGAVLCIWLFFLGVFLLGASTAPVIAAAVYSGTGHPVPPLVLLIFAVVLGCLALLLKKFTVIACTSVAGSYLITAGLWQVLKLGQNGFPLQLARPATGSVGMINYVALACWVILALVGLRFQYSAHRKKPEPARQEVAAA
jgi:Domain of unknown function (DUF4203)